MKVVILCGGQGTRLREETEFRPKPLVPVGGRPILWHIMKIYAHHGYQDFILCLGYRGEMIKDYFLNYEAFNNDFTIRLGSQQHIQFHHAHEEKDFTVTLADTGLDSMTGSRIRQIMQYLDDDTFMVTYGDGVSDVDINKLLAFHHAHGRLATVTSVRQPSRFGILETGEANRVIDFAEKPQINTRVNAGFYVFNRKVMDYLDEDANCILEQGPLNQLAQDGKLMAYHHEGFFYAMDTYREYLALNELWEQGNAPWKIWKNGKVYHV
jgi:glucose-1-phosphate cytidylyltransferase